MAFEPFNRRADTVYAVLTHAMMNAVPTDRMSGWWHGHAPWGTRLLLPRLLVH
jgi:hypothetical protein